MTILAAITLAAFAAGAVAAAIVWRRQGSVHAGVIGVFALGAVRQATVLWSGPAAAPGRADWIAEAALLVLALCALAVLRALDRTTRDRDRVEDLHWNAMETVRRLSEPGPGEGGDTGIARILAIGAERFGLERGAVWLDDGQGTRLLSPGQEDADPEAAFGAALPLLARAAAASRPVRVDLADTGDGRRVLFAAPLPASGGVRGALAFVGDAGESPPTRFGATDKDLIALMAASVAGDVAERAGAEPARAPRPVALARASRRGATELAEALRIAERRLRRAVGADAALSVEPVPPLPALRPVGVALPRLVEGLVLAAARLAPSGRLAVEARPPPAPSPDASASGEGSRGDVLLIVRVDDPSLEASALERVFAPPDPTAKAPPLDRGLPLSQIEGRLRSAGGDLSVSLEPGRRAVLTAYLPALPSRGAQRALAPGAQSSR